MLFTVMAGSASIARVWVMSLSSPKIKTVAMLQNYAIAVISLEGNSMAFRKT
jgi:hypothetical protein